MADKFRTYSDEELAKIYEDAARIDEETAASRRVSERMQNRLGGDSITFPTVDREGRTIPTDYQTALIDLQSTLEGLAHRIGGTWDPEKNKPVVPEGKEAEWKKVASDAIRRHRARELYASLDLGWD